MGAFLQTNDRFLYRGDIFGKARARRLRKSKYPPEQPALQVRAAQIALWKWIALLELLKGAMYQVEKVQPPTLGLLDSNTVPDHLRV